MSWIRPSTSRQRKLVSQHFVALRNNYTILHNTDGTKSFLLSVCPDAGSLRVCLNTQCIHSVWWLVRETVGQTLSTNRSFQILLSRFCVSFTVVFPYASALLASKEARTRRWTWTVGPDFTRAAKHIMIRWKCDGSRFTFTNQTGYSLKRV